MRLFHKTESTSLQNIDFNSRASRLLKSVQKIEDLLQIADEKGNIRPLKKAVATFQKLEKSFEHDVTSAERELIDAARKRIAVMSSIFKFRQGSRLIDDAIKAALGFLSSGRKPSTILGIKSKLKNL